MTDMIERVARAMHTYGISHTHDLGEEGLWENLRWYVYRVTDARPTVFEAVCKDKQEARQICDRLNARAAIEAMREPTEDMLSNTVDEAGRMRIMEFTRPEERSKPFLVGRFTWRAMITAALKDTQP